MPTSSLLRRAAVLAALAMLVLSLSPALAAGPLSLRTPFPAVSVGAPSNPTFDITVTATANQRVGLSVSGTPDGWTASLRGGGFVVDAIQTDDEGTASVRLAVTVPETAPAGASTITVTATAGSSTVTLPLDITVSDEAAGAITLTTDVPSLQGPAGQTYTFNLVLHNDTSEDQTFAVTAVGPAGWTVNATLTGQAQAASAVVQAGSTANISVSATPPDQVEASTYPIGVRATVGSQTIDGNLSVIITGTNGLTLDTPDGLLSNHGSAGSTISQQLVLTNTGTSTLENVTISSTPPRDWTVTFDPSETIASLAANESTTVTATVTPSNDAIAGDYQVSFRASGTDVNDSVDIRMTIETSALWGFIGLGLIIAVLAGLWWVFRTYGRR